MKMVNWMQTVKQIKDQLFNTPTTEEFLSTYKKIYEIANDQYIKALTLKTKDIDVVKQLVGEIDRLNQFFDALSGQDIFFTLWILDEEGKNIFKNIGYESAFKTFPIFIKFFDAFDTTNFSNLNSEFKKLIGYDNINQFVDEFIVNYDLSSDEIITQKKIINRKLKSIRY